MKIISKKAIHIPQKCHICHILHTILLIRKDKESSTERPSILYPYSEQSMALKIEVGLFTNSLISESDLLTGNYDPEIINNIDKVIQIQIVGFVIIAL